MVLGEKLWEGRGKAMGMVIKGTNAEGVSMEYTWMTEVKGMGRAKGADGSILFTENVVVSPTRGATSIGNGWFNTASGDMAVIKGFGIGKSEGAGGKGVSVWSYTTMSKKLDWMNKLLTVVSTEGTGQEFDLVIYEWK